MDVDDTDRPREPKHAGTIVQKLHDEADLLARLYKRYLDDRDFLSQAPDHRILYFLDSHDIKAFINPDAPGSLDGFEIGPERLHRGDRAEAGSPDRITQVKLRHDQLMSGLLFAPSSLVGLLPSHGQEMDQEVEFRFSQAMAVNLSLVEIARAEIKRIRETAQRLATFAAQSPGPKTQHALVQFFQQNAPALTAILRDNLATTGKRLRMVLDESQLLLPEEFTAGDLGIGRAAGSGPPDAGLVFAQTPPPPPPVVIALRDRLASLPYRRNTPRANTVDAAALAHVAVLQTELGRQGHTNVRVVLVSRARTLLRAAMDIAEADTTPPLVRHPRLLAFRSGDAARLDSAAAPTLGTALSVFVAHLAGLNRLRDADAAALADPSLAFLHAWDAFETSRLAIEVQWRRVPVADPVDDEKKVFRQLLDLFCSERQAGAILNEMLVHSFASFGAAASHFLMGRADLALPARVERLHAIGRLRITPRSNSQMGYIQVACAANVTDPAGVLGLNTIADLVDSPAEKYLIWSLALACSGKWHQAGLFAKGAQKMAGLQQHGGPTDDEARLLRAQIRRLGAEAPADADNDVQGPARRYEKSMADLQGVSAAQAGRRLQEEAAQLLEALLSGVERPDLTRAEWKGLENSLYAAIDSAADPVSQVDLIASLLSLHLAAARDPSIWPGRDDAMRQAAKVLHAELVRLLDRLGQGGLTELVSRRVRAVAVIGYVVFEPAQTGKRMSAIAELSAAVTNPQKIPEELRGELPDLIHNLGPTVCFDRIAAHLHAELLVIEDGLRRTRSPNLLLAPVRLPHITRLIFAQSDPFFVHVQRAYDTTDPVVDTLLTTGLDIAHMQPIETAIRELEAAAPLAARQCHNEMVCFTVRTELQFLSLLRAHLLPMYQRPAILREIADAYRAIARDYPNAALPLCRLDHVLEALGDNDGALAVLRRALDLVDCDPFLVSDPGGNPHWLQSLIRRRLSVLTVPQAAASRWQPDGEQAAQIAAEQVTALRAACQTLIDAERRDLADAGQRSHAHDLEAARRTNNMVCYISRILERDGGRDALRDLDFAQTPEAMVASLMPDGIDAQDDPGTLHTIGCFYAATGRLEDAARAGKKLLELVIGGVKELSGANADALLKEAVDWFQAAQKRAGETSLPP